MDSELETDIVLLYGTAVPAVTSPLSSPHQHEPLQFRPPSRRLAGGPAPPSPRLVPPVRLWRSASTKSVWRTPSLLANCQAAPLLIFWILIQSREKVGAKLAIMATSRYVLVSAAQLLSRQYPIKVHNTASASTHHEQRTHGQMGTGSYRLR